MSGIYSNRPSQNNLKPLPRVFSYAKIAGRERKATRCEACEGLGCRWATSTRTVKCLECGSIGYFGIIPELPTICPPGTQEKLVVIRARDAVELPMDNPGDATLEGVCIDRMKHSPLTGLQTGYSLRLDGTRLTESVMTDGDKPRDRQAKDRSNRMRAGLRSVLNELVDVLEVVDV